MQPTRVVRFWRPNLPSGNGGSVLQNATVSPFLSAPGSTFTWSVSIFPQYIPQNSSPALWIDLFISTCPGATGTNSPDCASGYPLYIVNHTFPGGLKQPTVVSFAYVLNGTEIWSWQMGIAYDNTKTGNLTWTFLVGDPTYNGIEGPITGDYWSTYGLLIFTILEAILFYLGLVYFIALLLYMILKNRKRRQQEQKARANPPPPVAGLRRPRHLRPLRRRSLRYPRQPAPTARRWSTPERRSAGSAAHA